MPDSPSLAKHQPYLVQGVVNFFMDQGKVALVASEDAETQAGFEAALEQQVQTQLGCDIIRLHARADEDMLETFNTLLSKISVQQATQANAERQANYLLWVSENEHFTPERFQLLKNIILQFSGLQLKLLVSVTSDRWSGRLFDIAGRKIAYWFIPSGEAHRSSAPVAAVTSAASMPPAAAAVTAATAAPIATATTNESITVHGDTTPPPTEPATPVKVSSTSSTSSNVSSPSGRNLNVWVPAVGLLVLVGAAAFWLNDRAPKAAPPIPDTPAQALTPTEAASGPESESSQPAQPNPDASSPTPADPAATPLAQASVVTAPTPVKVGESGARGANQATNPSVAKTPAPVTGALSAAEAPVAPTSPKPDPAPEPKVTAINTLADCPKGAEANTLPTAKPVSYVKDTNYIFIKSKQSRKVCVAPAGGPYRLLNLQANQGNSAFGNGPWRVYSPDLRQIELYFQGARVTLGANVKDSVLVIPR